jgi:PTS system nitrogen regulatory IIA component
MRISELIPPEDVLLDVVLKDKPQALKFIADELSIDRVLDPERVRAALAAREDLGSTGVGEGIALPHVCIPELDASVGLFLRVTTPINFDSIDGKPVDIICAVISPEPEKCGANPPLSILAALARLLKDKSVADDLRQARNVTSVCKILSRSETLVVTKTS